MAKADAAPDTLAGQELKAIKEQEQKVQKHKHSWQTKKEELAQARKAYEAEIELLQEMIRGDSMPLYASAE